MAKGDISIVDTGGLNVVPTRTYKVQDRTSSSESRAMAAGDPIKKSGNYALLCASGDPEQGTDTMLGIAAKASTETATADGEVEAYVCAPNVVFRAKATTPANMDTASELLGLLNDSVTFDLSTNTFTVDENEGDDPDVHGLIIVGGNITDGTIDFIFNQHAVQGTSII